MKKSRPIALLVLTCCLAYFLTGCVPPPPYQREKVPVESVTIGGGDRLLAPGESVSLHPATTVLPENATNPSLIWNSSDTDVVTVTTYGRISAVAVGEATITAVSVENDAVRDSVHVRVTVLADGLTIIEDDMRLFVNETAALTAVISPPDAVNKNIIWSTGNEAAVTVTENGFITAVAAGTAVIKAESECNPELFYDSVTVEVVVNPLLDTIDPAVTARDLTDGMGVGWNLGNAFDSHSDQPPLTPWVGSPANAGRTVAELEGAWAGVRNNATRQLIAAVRAAGFNTVRFPVTWYKVTDGPPHWNIRGDWMDRIYEVVRYAAEEEMFIVLNTHHEERVLPLSTNPAEAGSALFARTQGIDFSLNFVEKIWKQIAERFIEYDEHLIFEGLNEPRTKSAAGFPSPNEWNGGTAEERNNLNRLNQRFVDTVRATGGNNRYRVLSVPTHAASASAAALNGFSVPDDPLNAGVNKIIMSVHTYAPFHWAHGEPLGSVSANYPGTGEIVSSLQGIQTRAGQLNIPVILGEWGSVNGPEDSRDGERLIQRKQHAREYVKIARDRGMIPIVWDDGGSFQLVNRETSIFTFRGLAVVEGLMEGLAQSS